MDISYRQIRAAYTDESITVYQAYDAEIADAAVAAQRLVPPFKRERMTWIKPSFSWMMYRCGWGKKPDQARVLAVDITRDGFEWALRHSCLSHPRDRAGKRPREHPVRIQWDPERDPHHNPLPYRSIQIGLSGEAVTRYVDEWTVAITDLTDRVHGIHQALRDGHDITDMLPGERRYPLSEELARTVGATTVAPGQGPSRSQ
ncbi:DUF4291 domain-containing protein [Spongiactinospora sp. TRM90649]|uniref:DUF4291 domain-containing protein n=1 Tax=Spongiactinospora sp. TRM90649 TaxID=3031114 RepID=UPI0023F829C3|nr:DUF4291 domain-containing protein [Spongiactinospora sp. TRM90649]MDF5754573.1 DUF4291 domain-containing protein [Spongiactinospora sp. TRM90649]